MKRLGRGRRRVYGTAASAASQWKCLLPKAGPRASGPLGLLLLWHLAFQRGPVRRLSLGARRKVSLRAPPCPRRLRGELLGIPVAHSHSSLSLSSPHCTRIQPRPARPPARCSTPAPQRIARALSVCRCAACAPAHPHHPATEISAWPYRSRWRTAWLHQFSENRIRQAQSPRWTARRSQRPGTQSGLVVKLVRLFAWCLQLRLCSPSALRRQPPAAISAAARHRSRPLLALAPTSERRSRSALSGWPQAPETVISDDLPCRGRACCSVACMADCSALMGLCVTAAVSRCFPKSGTNIGTSTNRCEHFWIR